MGWKCEGAMGALVPFPKRRPQPDSLRPPAEGPAKIIILPVVQLVRPVVVPKASAGGETERH